MHCHPLLPNTRKTRVETGFPSLSAVQSSIPSFCTDLHLQQRTKDPRSKPAVGPAHRSPDRAGGEAAVACPDLHKKANTNHCLPNLFTWSPSSHPSRLRQTNSSHFHHCVFPFGQPANSSPNPTTLPPLPYPPKWAQPLPLPPHRPQPSSSAPASPASPRPSPSAAPAGP